MKRFPVILWLIALFLPIPGWNQFISIKTVPLATGDQFQVFPSRRMALGNLSIAVDDPWSDPFINPARGARLNGVQVFTAPTFYSITKENGAGRSLPLGTLFHSGKWFGGFAVAGQQLNLAERRQPPIFFPGTTDRQTQVTQGLSDKNPSNWYVFGLAGTRLGNSSLSVGGSLFYADLEAVEGTELLYASSVGVEQFGSLLDFRVGLFGELSGERTVEALVLYNRYNMTHDVSYSLWQRCPECTGPPEAVVVERNPDRTRTWGLHFRYTQPLATTSTTNWRVGGIFTFNRKSHPKIPNYELMNIPRDPGNSYAFQFGLGLAGQSDKALFGMEVIYEPIWSNTWADAAEPVRTASGGTLPAGAKTVINDFQFGNWMLRLGLAPQERPFALRFGLEVHNIRYRLEQENRVQETFRKQRESWWEWSPSIGFALRYPGFNLDYALRLTLGTGRPGLAIPFTERMATASSDVLLAPAGELALDGAVVISHQVSLVIPIRE
ncbi:MAG: hypothetical protein D6681_03960 [Calditrichaeota bacterium]|nr:MAG: hypothetical protein D6681_03960 [Calditrichota bacterium]